jgi:hypothetical protein
MGVEGKKGAPLGHLGYFRGTALHGQRVLRAVPLLQGVVEPYLGSDHLSSGVRRNTSSAPWADPFLHVGAQALRARSVNLSAMEA